MNDNNNSIKTLRFIGNKRYNISDGLISCQTGLKYEIKQNEILIYGRNVSKPVLTSDFAYQSKPINSLFKNVQVSKTEDSLLLIEGKLLINGIVYEKLCVDNKEIFVPKTPKPQNPKTPSC